MLPPPPLQVFILCETWAKAVQQVVQPCAALLTPLLRQLKGGKVGGQGGLGPRQTS